MTKKPGRPPMAPASRRVTVNLRLAPDVVDILRQQDNAGRYMDEAVRAYSTHSSRPKPAD